MSLKNASERTTFKHAFLTDEVVVVGAGIVGICCGLSLLEKGLPVTLIDREGPAQATSSGNAGVVSPWSNVPQCIPGVWKNIPRWLIEPESPVRVAPMDAIRLLPWALRFLKNANMDKAVETSDAMAALNQSNIETYRYFLRGTGHEGLLRDSMYVHVFRDKEKIDLTAAAWQIRARHGTPIEVVTGDDLRQIEPALSPDYEAAVLIKDQARIALPGRFGEVLAEKFQALGGTVMRGSVSRISQDEDKAWRVESETGEIRTPNLVLAAGAWSADLLAPLGIALPLQTERGYNVTFKEPGIELNNSIMETSRLFVSSSMENGVRSAGTTEFAQLDAKPDYRRSEVLKRHTKDMFPAINVEDVEVWMGNRPSFPDNLPCIGIIPGHPGLFAAFGHSHWGMGMAPKTGRIIADLVKGERPNIDLAPYNISRFKQ